MSKILKNFSHRDNISFPLVFNAKDIHRLILEKVFFFFVLPGFKRGHYNQKAGLSQNNLKRGFVKKGALLKEGLRPCSACPILGREVVRVTRN